MMNTGILILLMASGILTASLDSSSGPDEEERDQDLDDILGEELTDMQEYLQEPTENNSTNLTNTTSKFDVLDEDIVEKELSDAETDSSDMSTLEITLVTTGSFGALVLLSCILLSIYFFLRKGRQAPEAATQAIKGQDQRQEKI